MGPLDGPDFETSLALEDVGDKYLDFREPLKNPLKSIQIQD
jgi:hypothetical protein